MPSITSFDQLEALAFRRQQIAFGILTLFVIAVLLVIHTLFASLLGEPSAAVILLLGGAFSLKMLEVIWLQGKREGIDKKIARIETFTSVVALFLLAFLLAYFTNRDDPPYFVLLAIPILQCAYHLRLVPTILTIVAAVGMMFAWAYHFFSSHPPPRPTEYLEIAMIAAIYTLMGLLVWYLVNQLRSNEQRLYSNMRELESTRERLIAEEKLSAVGRFASSIAHEIRNPVAMITSALGTAKSLSAEGPEREEMFGIAGREARRLEKLTKDFLTYARPVRPDVSEVSLADILEHIVELTRMHAAGRNIAVTFEMVGSTHAVIDQSQIEAALLNLCLNAVDATPEGGRIEVRSRNHDGRVSLDVQNSGRRIEPDNLKQVFEPFFTTKPGGTGLGLAIARGIALAHGGDLYISKNEDGNVVFTLQIINGSGHPGN
ncbi:sensor histidine kinase [Occallatibacter savannae]|uniref:sensor histidine kinase n=1 Tax=Occallatibacter savannae TaxID=1002691 RepID=UPI0013A583A1|nr:ATP-binding protein [Occallatibacter savannae]